MAERLLHDRYRLLERHAIGGMASVWRARDERTGEIVALKRLHPFLIADATARARLHREAAALRALDHPAIVRPRELIGEADDPTLVMDFAQGRSLKERIERDGPVPADEAAAIAGIVADALDVAHRAGIVHRDVKPSNILVEDTGAVHLVDFGIATGADVAGTILTASRTVVGTPRYTAPERLAGDGATPRSDVWALGAVLHEMLTGEPVVAHEAGSKPRDGRPIAISERVPPTIAAVVERALSPDPADRYPDAGAFRDALDAAEPAVDPDDPTVAVQLMTASSAPARGRAPAWWSPVDRAAAVFFGAVALVALAATITLGLGGLASGVPPTQQPAVPPATLINDGENVAATPTADEDGDEGRGNGKGNGNGGNGNGNGKGKDDGGD